MKQITVPTAEQVSPLTQELFQQLEKKIGKVPNLYATMGYSEKALKGFLDLDTTLAGGVFTPKEREAIALVVSEVNGCEYCLAAHTLTALRTGHSREETLAIREGHATDPKLGALVALAKSVAENQGHVPDAPLEAFFAAGYNEAALMDLVGLIAVRVFTNYVYALTHIPLDFPAAPSLHKTTN
jgi:uncharacterized peroxidase-related enzyme